MQITKPHSPSLSMSNIVSRVLQVFFVSDFFKPRAVAHKEVDIPHTTLQETATNGNHFESPN